MTQATGRAATATNLEQLTALLKGRLREDSWNGIEQLLLLSVADTRLEEPFAQHLPLQRLETSPDFTEAGPVLVDSAMASTHLRLAAFLLGVTDFEKEAVYMDFPFRTAPFRLFAATGVIRGASPL